MRNISLIRRYNKDRDKAVASLNVETFKAFCRKWSLPIPPKDEIIEITMRKMMFHINTFSEEDKKAAKEWLESRNYTTDLE